VCECVEWEKHDLFPLDTHINFSMKFNYGRAKSYKKRAGNAKHCSSVEQPLIRKCFS
jgi:hypothetical protein